MRIQAAGIAVVAFVLSAVPVVAQEDASPEPSASPPAAPSVAASAEPSAAPNADAGVSTAPGPITPNRPTAKEVYDNLERMANGRHPKADYKKVVREAMRFLEKNPHAVMPPRKLWGNKKASPKNVFAECRQDMSGTRGYDHAYTNCTAAVRMLYWAYLTTRDEEMLDIADRFIGATRGSLHKRYPKVTRDFVDMSFREQADLFRAPVDLPPVTDKEHVAIVLVDPGVLDRRGLIDTVAMYKGIDPAEVKELLRQLPVTVLEDLTYKQAKDALPWLMVGTSSWGITDAASAPGTDARDASLAPSEAPAAA